MSSIDHLPGPYHVLLSRGGGTSLPVPAPLDLAEIPFIRATYKLEERDANGNLPIEAYKITHEAVTAEGARYRITIQGSAEHGLPYGNDGDILLALFKLIDQHNLTDGLFRNPSVRMIADAIGLPMTGQNAERVRGALARFSHVRFETRQIFRAEEVAAAISSGEPGAQPLAPDSGVPRRKGTRPSQQEEVTWLIQYRWQTSYDRSDEGEQWIKHLWVNPVWVSQAVAGWAAWVDTAVYSALSGPIARRLYQIMASLAARGRPAPWTFTLEDLRAACAMSAASEPKKLRDRLLKGGNALMEQGVLRRFEVESPKKGHYRFLAEPGPVLETASTLRGVGLLDPWEVRVQLLLLNHFGVNARVARQMVRDHAHQVFWVLCYMTFREESGERTDNPGGFIRRLVQEGFNPRGDEVFRKWYDRRSAEGLKEPETVSLLGPSTPPAAAVAAAPAPMTLPGFEVDGVAPEAAALWEAALARFTESQAPDGLLRAHLTQIAAYAITDDTLVCVASADLYAWRVRERAADALKEIIVELSQGRVRSLEIRDRLPPPSPASA